MSAADAARVLYAACKAAGASPSTCWLVPGLFLAQLEQDARRRG